MIYQELLSKKAALEKEAAELQEQIDNAQRSERAEVVNQIKSLMTQYRITLADLSGRGGDRSKRNGAKATQPASKVPVKYRDSATGDSWTGRGLQPKWLKAALAAGRKLEEFLIS